MHAEEVLLGRGGQGERVPLQRRDGRALDQDVLTGRHGEAALPHAQLQDAGRVADHLDRARGYWLVFLLRSRNKKISFSTVKQTQGNIS